VKQDFLFTVLDNQFVVSRQIDLLTVLLEKELAPYFDVQKVGCPNDLMDISFDTSSSKPRILLRNYDFSIPPSYRCIQVSIFMPNILHGFDVADGIIDSVIKHSFI
jgi:hypothetical protein